MFIDVYILFLTKEVRTNISTGAPLYVVLSRGSGFGIWFSLMHTITAMCNLLNNSVSISLKFFYFISNQNLQFYELIC
jgi:hypothetical protein